ncbi:MAG: hypothetical protein Q8L24_01175 [bacterium]|nr:hypothetical protein [bacterium]
MQNILQQIADGILAFRAAVGDFLGPNLFIFEILSLIISALLLWGIIFAAGQSNYFEKRIEDWMDYLGRGDVGKRRRLRAWKTILKKMQSAAQTDWKVAIMEADRILDDMIRAAGFRATATDERFKQIAPTFVANFDEIQEAHKIRNRCAQEPDFEFSKEEAIRVLRIYKKAFQEFGLLD